MNAHFDLSRIRQTADELDKLLGDDDERLFHDMLLGESDIDRVVARIHEQVERDKETLVGIAERKKALDERKARIERRADAGKSLIGKVLRAGRLPKLELPDVTYSVRDGSPTLRVVDPAGVPEDLQRIKREPDKPAINKRYADAADLPNWLTREPAIDVVTARTK